MGTNQLTQHFHPNNVIPLFKSLLPETVLESFSAIPSNQILGSDVLDLSFQRFIVFLSSNNFPGLDEGKIVVLFKYLVNQSSK